MEVVVVEDFIPAQGRTVVYGFRNPAAWETDPVTGLLRRKENSLTDPFIYRPAQIVHVWAREGMKTVNLVVFLDGSNDRGIDPYASPQNLTFWKTSVVIGTEGSMAVGAEHYLPRVPEGYSGQ